MEMTPVQTCALITGVSRFQIYLELPSGQLHQFSERFSMPQKIGRRLFLIATASSLSPAVCFSQGTEDRARVLASFSFGRGIYYFNPAGLHVEVGQWSKGENIMVSIKEVNFKSNHLIFVNTVLRPQRLLEF